MTHGTCRTAATTTGCGRAALAAGLSAGMLLILGAIHAPASLAVSEGDARRQASAPAGPTTREAAFHRLLESLSGAPLHARLDGVNRFFNALTYRTDTALWGREDHWATPAELLRTGAGDCEDLAIGKYFALRRLGVPAAAMRISYMRDLRRNASHMVLSYLSAGPSPLLLDNLEDGVRPADRRPELVAIYGFNEERVTVQVPGGGERSYPHEGRFALTRWASLLRRRNGAVPAAVRKAVHTVGTRNSR